MLSELLFRETQKGRKVTGVQWNEESLCVIVQLHWRLGHASLKLIRSDSYKRVTMLRWIEFVSSTVLSIAYLSVQWTVLQINGVQTIGAVCKGTFPTVLSDMKMDTHWHMGKERNRQTHTQTQLPRASRVRAFLCSTAGSLSGQRGVRLCSPHTTQQ